VTERDAAHRSSVVDSHHRRGTSIHASPDAPRAPTWPPRTLLHPHVSLSCTRCTRGSVEASARARPGLIRYKRSTLTRDETCRELVVGSAMSSACRHLREVSVDPEERRPKDKVDFDRNELKSATCYSRSLQSSSFSFV